MVACWRSGGGGGGGGGISKGAAFMASYQLIRESGDEVTSHFRGRDCSKQCLEGGHCGDVESYFHEIYPSSPRLRSVSAGADTAASKSTRLLSLDVFRGLAVLLMILVDDLGGIIPAINHSPWNGLTLADFVMPFFLFMVGVSLGLVYKTVSCNAAATKKVIWRTLKLLILGIILQGGFFHGINNLTYGVDLKLIRWMGVLQRIAAAYFVAAMCEIWLRNDEKVNDGVSLLKKYQWHWTMMLMLTAVYIVLLYGLYVPDWEYQIPYGVETKIFRVKCGVRGDTGPGCNAAGMIDRTILGIQHIYKKPSYARTKRCSINSPKIGLLAPDAPPWCQAPFDPEGLLSTLLAIVTCLIGLQYGHVIIHFKDHKTRTLLWLMPSCFIFIGTLCDILGMHINKGLYSFSYMCVTTGVAGILFATVYLVVDVYGWSRYTRVLRWMGMNALLMYALLACNVLPLLLQGFYWGHPRNNILSLIGIGKQAH